MVLLDLKRSNNNNHTNDPKMSKHKATNNPILEDNVDNPNIKYLKQNNHNQSQIKKVMGIVLIVFILMLVCDWLRVALFCEPCVVEAQCEGTTTCVNGFCELFLTKTSLGFGCIAPCYEEYKLYMEHYYLKDIELKDGYGSIKGCTIEFETTGSNNGSTKEEYDAKTTRFGTRLERVKGTDRWAGMCESIVHEEKNKEELLSFDTPRSTDIVEMDYYEEFTDNIDII